MSENIGTPGPLVKMFEEEFQQLLSQDVDNEIVSASSAALICEPCGIKSSTETDTVTMGNCRDMGMTPQEFTEEITKPEEAKEAAEEFCLDMLPTWQSEIAAASTQCRGDIASDQCHGCPVVLQSYLTFQPE